MAVDGLVEQPVKRSLGSRISRIVWDRDDKPEHERKFVRYLDLHLFVIACLGYFIKCVANRLLPPPSLTVFVPGISTRRTLQTRTYLDPFFPAYIHPSLI